MVTRLNRLNEAELRRFLRVPTIYVLSKNKKCQSIHLKIIISTAFKNLCIMPGHVCVWICAHIFSGKCYDCAHYILLNEQITLSYDGCFDHDLVEEQDRDMERPAL